MKTKFSSTLNPQAIRAILLLWEKYHALFLEMLEGKRPEIYTELRKALDGANVRNGG